MFENYFNSCLSLTSNFCKHNYKKYNKYKNGVRFVQTAVFQSNYMLLKILNIDELKICANIQAFNSFQ